MSTLLVRCSAVLVIAACAYTLGTHRCQRQMVRCTDLKESTVPGIYICVPMSTTEAGK